MDPDILAAARDYRAAVEAEAGARKAADEARLADKQATEAWRVAAANVVATADRLQTVARHAGEAPKGAAVPPRKRS